MKMKTLAKTSLWLAVSIGLTGHANGADKALDSVDIGGYLMLDYNAFGSGFLEDGSGSTDEADIRRARLSLKADLFDDWKVKLQLALESDDAEIKDAYIRYKGWDWANFTLGQQKEPFGLEKLTSSRNLPMIERSIVTEALTPDRSVGINMAGEFEDVNWQVGYFLPDESESAAAISGRITWQPWHQDANMLHLGAAFSKRSLNGSEFRINEQMEVYYSDSLIEGEKLQAENSVLQGIELLWQINGFSTMAEWQQATITDINNLDYDYRGGYIQLSYQLSGENRKYKNGVLGKVTDSGWEVTSRYSHLELLEENHESDIYSFGINYYATKKLKFMADYIKAEQLKNGTQLNDSAISVRMQYSF